MKKVMVTTSWDDGHKLDLKIAQLLNKYDINGTFYVTPKNREFPREELLSDEDIIAIGKEFEIGAHTLTHPLLPDDFPTAMYKIAMKLLKTLEGREYKIPPAINYYEAKKEVLGSKQYLENLLNRKIVSFSYPAGRHNVKISKLVEESGFAFARTVAEYTLSAPGNFMASGTSIHANRHRRDIFQKARFSKWSFSEFKKNFDWEHLAKRMFDRVIENGGLYHLWGHSWLIDQNGDWGKLEKVFSYIANHKDIEYVTNSQVVSA